MNLINETEMNIPFNLNDQINMKKYNNKFVDYRNMNIEIPMTDDILNEAMCGFSLKNKITNEDIKFGQEGKISFTYDLSNEDDEQIKPNIPIKTKSEIDDEIEASMKYILNKIDNKNIKKKNKKKKIRMKKNKQKMKDYKDRFKDCECYLCRRNLIKTDTNCHCCVCVLEYFNVDIETDKWNKETNEWEHYNFETEQYEESNITMCMDCDFEVKQNLDSVEDVDEHDKLVELFINHKCSGEGNCNR